MYKMQMERIIISILIVLCVIPFFIKTDPFKISNGESPLWLCVMFLVGAYIKKYGLRSLTSKGAIKGYCFMIGLTFGTGVGVMFLTKRLWGTARGAGILLGYISPTVIVAAMFLLCYFEKLEIKSLFVQKIIRVIATATLGVYLIHDNVFIRKNIIKDFSKVFIHDTLYIMLIKLVGSVLIIFFLSAGIELLRRKLFHLLRIDFIVERIVKKYNL